MQYQEYTAGDNHEADLIYIRKDGQYAGKRTNSTTVILQEQTDAICSPSTSRINNEGKTSKNNQNNSNLKRKNSDTSNHNSVKNKQTKKPRIDVISNHGSNLIEKNGDDLLKFTEEEFEKILTKTQNMEKEIKDFIIRDGHKKSLIPKIGNPVSAVEDYIDKTRKLTEKQRTIFATFLCNSYREISFRTPDVASLIHNIITFVLEFNETDIAEERIHLEVDTENIRKTCLSDDGTENLEPFVLSDIKYPPKLSRKGRPKGSEKTVIGITKKSKRYHLQPFFKKSSGIKELAILQWILGDEKGRTVFEDKENVFQNEVQDLAFSSALIDDSVDLLIVFYKRSND